MLFVEKWFAITVTTVNLVIIKFWRFLWNFVSTSLDDHFDRCVLFAFFKNFGDNTLLLICSSTIRDGSLPIARMTDYSRALLHSWTRRVVRFPCFAMHKLASLGFLCIPPTFAPASASLSVDSTCHISQPARRLVPLLAAAAWVGRLTPMQPGGPRSDFVTSRHSSSPANQCSNTPKWY